MPLDYRSIMSGQRTDPLAVLMRGLLGAASIPYGIAVSVRNRRFDSGRSEIHACGVPVVSVGNLTTGGTGKTPIVCFLAKWFRQRGVRVAVVSRGYGRKDGNANDEALELRARLPDVPHVQDPDRVAAARIAVEQFDAQLVIMDDGFQHRRLHRDLNLVVIDAMCPFGYGHLLPRGLLREPVENLRRADAVMITRCDAEGQSVIETIEKTVRRICGNIPILRCTHQPTTLLQYPDSLRPISELKGSTVCVFSAIGNPDAFEATVRDYGATIAAARRFPDHDEYTAERVRELHTWVQSLGDQVTRVLCTHKDLVKLQTDQIGGKPLAAVLIELTLQSEITPLEKELKAIEQLIDSQEHP